ncbi:MAG: hypothetical protein WCR21_06930 [Bacteroidota bacterium]
MAHKTASTIFFEIQQFRNHWFWQLLLLAPFSYFCGVLAYQLYSGKFVGDHPASNFDLALLLLFYGSIAYFALFYVKLTTVISAEKISYGWNLPSAQLNEIKVEDIQSCELVTYHFVGYGYRFSLKYGRVYNVWGNKGLLIIMKNGKKIMLGTNSTKHLKSAINQIPLLNQQAS